MNDSTESMPRIEVPTPAAGSEAWHYVRHAGIVAIISGFVGISLGIFKGGQWTLQLVYSEAIGLSIWACTDFGRLLFRREPDSNWPAGWRALVLQAGAVVLGYVIGTWIGDEYCGCSTFELWRHSARAFASYLVLCIAISASISYFFLAQGRDQRRLRQIATAQRDATEAQLKLLESQLEPHMLFNTLANLRALIGIDPPRAQAMLDQLVAYLRATLSASRAPTHALSAEFARLSDYLDLMQVRMGDRLRTRFDLPAELSALPVPPLLLQPLVENAIKHGLEPHVGGGRIEVSARRTGDALQLRVRDTGAGLSGTAAADGTRFGLTHVRERLSTLYGDAATLDLAPAPEGEDGTVATIKIPL
ncbi:MAG: histidine kinase [Caldimonas sp.]